MYIPAPGVFSPSDGALIPWPLLCDPEPPKFDGWLYEYPASGLATAKAMHDKTTNTFILLFSNWTGLIKNKNLTNKKAHTTLKTLDSGMIDLEANVDLMISQLASKSFIQQKFPSLIQSFIFFTMMEMNIQLTKTQDNDYSRELFLLLLFFFLSFFDLCAHHQNIFIFLLLAYIILSVAAVAAHSNR